MNVEQLEDSDSSDGDYVPETKCEHSSSELDSDEDTDQKNVPNEERCSRSKKRKKNYSNCKKKLKNINQCETTNPQAGVLTEEEKKQKADDVWADFMKETGFKSKSECITNVSTKSLQSINNDECTNSAIAEKKPKKVTITEVYNFAGENVIVEKEAKNRSEVEDIKEVSTSKHQVKESKSHVSGIGGLLSQLGKKSKINTLEKSKLDWDKFKREENLEEELQTFNRGKDGFLEKQDFLNRADLRRFEIEREIRTIERNKRMNN